METKVCKVSKESLALAKDYLTQGQVVAFSTETVYGLGAWAMSPEGVRRIYEAKGRPSDNPLIVHVAPGFNLEDMQIVSKVPEAAKKLMKRFWPGPLTLIMPKGEKITHNITGGLETVAVRMPSHPVALQLIETTGMPIVAPSANTSGRPSPTTAVHVFEDMKGRIPLIIDGGECQVGLESTIVDLTGEVPMILRPGAITKEMLEEVLTEVTVDPAVAQAKTVADSVVPKAPGMKYRHYAPQGKLIITDATAQQLCELVKEAILLGKKTGLIVTDQLAGQLSSYMQDVSVEVLCLGDRTKPEELAANLFGALRGADEKNLEVIYGEALSREGVGEAIMNRFLKASSKQLWLNQ
ncbi:MAG: threonylcarbamoyl-AMP synthase [Firmicutes bacterium]|nr:threonylcarbamoyl-AMP synthase [Bacillota bacterium]